VYEDYLEDFLDVFVLIKSFPTYIYFQDGQEKVRSRHTATGECTVERAFSRKAMTLCVDFRLVYPPELSFLCFMFYTSYLVSLYLFLSYAELRMFSSCYIE